MDFWIFASRFRITVLTFRYRYILADNHYVFGSTIVETSESVIPLSSSYTSLDAMAASTTSPPFYSKSIQRNLMSFAILRLPGHASRP